MAAKRKLKDWQRAVADLDLRAGREISDCQNQLINMRTVVGDGIPDLCHTHAIENVQDEVRNFRGDVIYFGVIAAVIIFYTLRVHKLAIDQLAKSI
jgi:hypothetical protein